jgi:tetratricopeptide (TPR) repeat protein
MSDLPNDTFNIDGEKPSIERRTTPTISDLTAIVVADNLDQEVCEFFSPLASASPLSLPTTSTLPKPLTSALPAAATDAEDPITKAAEQKEPAPNLAPMKKYEIISTFISNNAIQWVWMAVCLITLASTFDLLRAFSASKTEEATKLIAQEKYQEALTSASLAVRCNPFSARAYLTRGRALAKQLRLKQAFECFNNSLALAADDVSALDQRASLALKLNQPKVAIDDLSKIISTAPNQVAAYQYGNRAWAYFRLGEYKKALSDYEKALKLEPTNYSLQLGSALCLNADRQYAKALQTYTQLYNMEPDNNEVLMQKGFCRQCLGDKQGALKDFNQALKNDATTARWFSYRANLLSELNQKDQACDDFVKAANLEPNNETAQYTAAKSCKALKRKELALHFYDRLSQFPNFRTSFAKLSERASLNLEAGNYQEALRDLTSAIKLKQEPESIYQQAICYSHLNQSKLAKAACESATKLGAPTAKAFRYQAQIESLLGDTISAINNYSQALNLEPNNPKALAERGKLYLKREQWASASKDFKRAVEFGSTDTAVKQGLITCAQKLGKSAQVSIDLPKSFDVDLKKLTREKLLKDGYAQYQEGNSTIAALYFAELVERDPNDLEMRRYLAHSLARAHNHSEAISAFAVLSQGNRLNTLDKLTYAKELAASLQFDLAIKVIEELRTANPNSSSYAYELAQMLAASGQKKKAIALCTSSLSQTGSTDDRKNLENLYHSLINEQNKPVKPIDNSQPKPETEG